MNGFNTYRKADELKKERMRIQNVRDALKIAVCPYERHLLQDCLFRNIDQLLTITDELYRYLQEDYQNLISESRQKTEFTIEELSDFNGMNGKLAYAAVNGIVYDVSNEAAWGGASHFGLMAGQDLTDKFNSCHGSEATLSNLPKVGVLKQGRGLSGE